MALPLSFTFVNGTTAEASEVNANFIALAERATDKTGDTFEGTMGVRSLVPSVTASYDLGSSSMLFRNLFVRTGITLGQINGNYSIVWDNPGTDRILTIPSMGTNTSFVFTDGAQTLDSKVLQSCTFTPEVIISGASDGRGLFVSATATNRPALWLQNDTTGNLGLIQAYNTKDVAIFTNAGATLAFYAHASGGVSLGGSGTDPGSGGVHATGSITTAGVITGAAQYATAGAGVGLSALSGSWGAGAEGSSMFVGQNNSGSGAGGTVNFRGRASTNNFVWADSSTSPGILRIKTTAPVEDGGTTSDTSGTIVGAQSSTLDTKTILGPGVEPEVALGVMLNTPTYRFTYKGGAYSGTEFQGIVADESPMFAMDPDEAHPQGRSFNPVNGLGFTIQAIKALQAQIDELRAAR